MHGALLRANAVRTRLLALHYSDCAAQVRLPPLRSRARYKFGCAPLRGGGSANQTVRASLYCFAARVQLRDIPLRSGAAQSKFNHPPLLNGREILSSGRGE